jgi:hypothetical protein
MKINIFKQSLNKDEFIKLISVDIEHREQLREFFNTTFVEVVKRFDGKVYNARVAKAINEALQTVSPLFWADCDIKSPESYSNYPKNNYVEVVLKARREGHNYQNYQALYTKIMLDTDDKYNLRVSADMSKDEKYVIAWAENFDETTNEMKTTIKKYDEFCKVAQKVADSISEFSELPQTFRNNIAFPYLFYLK